MDQEVRDQGSDYHNKSQALLEGGKLKYSQDQYKNQFRAKHTLKDRAQSNIDQHKDQPGDEKDQSMFNVSTGRLYK